jgi:hypothetical protein
MGRVQRLAGDDDDGYEMDIVTDDPPEGPFGSEPIPDLSRLPEEQWLDALRPLSRNDRIRAQNTLPLERVEAAMALIGDLICEEGAARARTRAAPPARMPSGDPPPIGHSPPSEPRRQVNFRLGPDEHARLIAAARLFGMRPGVLARVLTVRGVDRALHDARRDE